MAADYDNFVQIEKDKLATYEEQVETQRAKREEALATLNKEMKENFIEFENKPAVAPATPAPAAANGTQPPSVITSESLTPAVLAAHMETDTATFQGMSQEQGMKYMQSMFVLFNNVAAGKAAPAAQQPPTPQPQQQQQQQGQQVETEGVGYDLTISDDEAESGDEEKMTLVVNRNKLRKTKREQKEKRLRRRERERA